MSLPTDDMISLPIILAWLRVNWGKMVLGGVAFALLALPVVLFKAKVYEAEVTLLISPPTFRDRSKALDPATIAEMMPRTLPVETYRALALSPPILDEVIRRVPLEGTGVQSLKGRLNVELVQLGSRSAQGITYSQALTFHARANEPVMAAKITQIWAEVFKEEMDRTAAKGVGETFSLLDSLHKTTMIQLEQADKTVAEHTKLWNLDLIKAQLEAKQKEYTDFESKLKQTEVDLASAEKKLAALETELANEPEKMVYFRAPSDDAYWIAGLEGGGKSKDAPDKGLRTEEANPNYFHIRASVVEARETIEGLKATKDAIAIKLDTLKSEIDGLNSTFADQTAERQKLTRESESMQESYKLVRGEYEKGRMANQTQASDIVMAGKAVPPDVPSSASSPKVVIAATVLGIILTGAFLIAKELSEVVPDRKSEGGEPEVSEKPA